MLATKFSELIGCRVPLQQAGMGGVATTDLVSAVADAGGLGMLALPLAPADMIAAALTGLQSRTTGAFGVNFLMPFLDPECVDAAADKARVLEFFYDQPDPSLVERAHTGGALAAWQVGSATEARQAVDAGCDFVIAQGTEAGGHVRGSLALLPLLAEVLEAIDVPVVAAGGIGTARAMAAALAAGAGGVRVGTRFLAAAEADVHPGYLERLIAAANEDTVLTETFSVMWPGAPHRVLRSAVEEAEAFAGEVVGETVLGGVTMAVPKMAVMCPLRSTTGAIGAMALYAGEAVGAVRGEQTAAEIVRELAEGAESLLRAWG